MPCLRCGQCCVDAFVSMWTITPETEKDIMEQGRWLAYHRCDILRFKDGGKEKIGIKIPLTCQQLKYIPGTGYTCKIYENRPKTCKMYTCDNFTAEEAAKIKQQKGGDTIGSSSNYLV